MENAWWKEHGDLSFPAEFSTTALNGCAIYDTEGVQQRGATFHWRQLSFAAVAQLKEELLDVWHDQKYCMLDDVGLAARGAAAGAAAQGVHPTAASAPGFPVKSGAATAATPFSAAPVPSAAEAAPTEAALRSLVWQQHTLDSHRGPGQVGFKALLPPAAGPITGPEPGQSGSVLAGSTLAASLLEPPQPSALASSPLAALPSAPLQRQLRIDLFGGVMVRWAEPEALCGWEPSPCFPLSRGGLRVLPNLLALHAAAHRHRQDKILNAVVVAAGADERERERGAEEGQGQGQQVDAGAEAAGRQVKWSGRARAFLVEGPGAKLVPLRGGPSPGAVIALWEAVRGALAALGVGAQPSGTDADADTADEAGAVLLYDILSRNWAQLAEGTLARSLPYKQLSEPSFPAGLLRTYLSCNVDVAGRSGSGGGKEQREEEQQHDDEDLQSLNRPELLAVARSALAQALSWQPAGDETSRGRRLAGGQQADGGQQDKEGAMEPEAQPEGGPGGGGEDTSAPAALGASAASKPAPAKAHLSSAAVDSALSLQEAAAERVACASRRRRPAPLSPRPFRPFRHPERYFLWPSEALPAARWVLVDPGPHQTVSSAHSREASTGGAEAAAAGGAAGGAAGEVVVDVAATGALVSGTVAKAAVDAGSMGLLVVGKDADLRVEVGVGGAKDAPGGEGWGGSVDGGVPSSSGATSFNGGGDGLALSGEPGAGAHGGAESGSAGFGAVADAVKAAEAGKLGLDAADAGAAALGDEDADPSFDPAGLQLLSLAPTVISLSSSGGRGSGGTGAGSTISGGGSNSADTVAGAPVQRHLHPWQPRGQGQLGQLPRGEGNGEEAEGGMAAAVPVAAAQTDVSAPGGDPTEASAPDPSPPPSTAPSAPSPVKVLPGLRHLPAEEAAALQDAFRQAAMTGPRRAVHLYGKPLPGVATPSPRPVQPAGPQLTSSPGAAMPLAMGASARGAAAATAGAAPVGVSEQQQWVSLRGALHADSAAGICPPWTRNPFQRGSGTRPSAAVDSTTASSLTVSGLPGLKHLSAEAAAELEEAFRQAASSGRRHMHLRSLESAPALGSPRLAPQGHSGAPPLPPGAAVREGAIWRIRGAVATAGAPQAAESAVQFNRGPLSAGRAWGPVSTAGPSGGGAGAEPAAAGGWPVLTYHSPSAPQGYVQVVASPSPCASAAGAAPGISPLPEQVALGPGARLQPTAFPLQPVVPLPIAESPPLAPGQEGPSAAQARGLAARSAQQQSGTGAQGPSTVFPPQARRVDRCFGLLGPAGQVLDPRDEERRIEQYRDFAQQVESVRRPAARGATTRGRCRG